MAWALEPLLVPDAQPEAARLSFTKGYRAHLEELFKGLLALARETHIKQLEIPSVGAPAPPPQIRVAPHLSVEPLATHFRRRVGVVRLQQIDEGQDEKPEVVFHGQHTRSAILGALR